MIPNVRVSHLVQKIILSAAQSALSIHALHHVLMKIALTCATMMTVISLCASESVRKIFVHLLILIALKWFMTAMLLVVSIQQI